MTQVFSAQYARDGIKIPSDLQSPPRAPSPISGDSRALHYYQAKVANMLGGAIDSEFWTTSILQLSEAEPAVKQALIAISDLWEAQMGDSFIDFAAAQRRHFEVYSKALATTARVKRQKILLLIYERMLVLLRLFGEKLPHFRSPATLLYNSISTVFPCLDNLEQARGALYWLVAESHELMLNTRLSRNGTETNDRDECVLQMCVQKQSIQLTAYPAWLEAFGRFCTAGRCDLAADDHYKANLLLVHTITVAWLSTCMDRDEAAWDKYIDSFRFVVWEADKVNSHNRKAAIPFTFEMGVIPPLYLTVLKRRDANIRLRALSLLEQAPAGEGLWNRSEALRVCRQVADLEDSTGQTTPDRIAFVGDRIFDARTVGTNEQGTKVIFVAKLGGHSELWKIWNEVIPIEESASSNSLSVCATYTQAGPV